MSLLVFNFSNAQLINAAPNSNSKAPTKSEQPSSSKAPTTTSTTSSSNNSNSTGNSATNGNSNANGNNAGNANQNAVNHANPNSAVAKANANKLKEDKGPTNRYIIRYNTASDLPSEVKALTDKKVKVDRTFSKIFKGAVANLTEKQVATLKNNPNLADIELDSTVSTTDLQSTTSWGLDRIDQRNLPLDSGFTFSSTGVNTTIYIVDTGIRSTHSEFSAA